MKEKRYACNQCDMSFSRLQSVVRHKKTVHQRIRSHACTQCDKRFSTNRYLKLHLLAHSGERQYACDQCDKKFILECSLKLHKQAIHQGIRPHKCEIRHKGFNSIAERKHHSVVHTGLYLNFLSRIDEFELFVPHI